MSNRDENEQSAETKRKGRKSLPGLLLGLMFGELGRPSFIRTLETVTEGLLVNLEANFLHDNHSVGVVLLQLASVCLRKAGVDKAKAQQLFDMLFEGKVLLKDDEATKLAAELLGGHVEPCSCEHPHLTIILDDLVEEPGAEKAPETAG